MPVTVLTADDDEAQHRAAYRYERDTVASATRDRLVVFLARDDAIVRAAARDELQRRGEGQSDD